MSWTAALPNILRPQSRGEASLKQERNPFYVGRVAGLAWVVAGLVAAAVIYLAVQYWLGSRLEQAVRGADGLSRILASSTLYPGTSGTERPPNPPVDLLAAAVWLDQLKIAPPGSTIEQLLEDDNYTLLFAALRFGGHCEGLRGALQPREMASVRRLVELGAFFADNCATKDGSAITPLVVDEMTRRIVAGGQSGSDLFKRVLVAHSVFDRPGDRPPVLLPTATLRQLQANLDAATTARDDAAKLVAQMTPQAPEYADAVTRRDAQEKVFEESKAKFAEAQKGVPALLTEDRRGAHDARMVVYGLEALRGRVDKTALGDPRMRQVEAFATALVSSIEADPDVSEARRYLAAATGYEQYSILALFLITSGLIFNRMLVFRRHRAAVVKAMEQLNEVVEASDKQGEPGEAREERRARREQQANCALSRFKGIGDPGRAGALRSSPSEIVVDITKALRSDLSQINLYGMSEERVDKTAEDLKEKIDNSRQLIEWGVTTLPALGFLGTVRGILMALSAVGGLGQGDNVARLSALLNVSGALGLAFSTTLIALVFMILLSYVDIRQGRGEKALVDSLRDFLNDRVLP